MSLINEPYMIRPTLTDLNPIQLNYYIFMISLDKCNGSCNVIDDLPTKLCVPNKIKGINAEVFNIITRIKNICKTYFV